MIQRPAVRELGRRHGIGRKATVAVLNVAMQVVEGLKDKLHKLGKQCRAFAAILPQQSLRVL